MNKRVGKYTLISEWKCGSSLSAVGTCDGKKYLLKADMVTKQPRPESSDAPIQKEKRLKRFETFLNKRRRINEELRSISSEGGNIVAPVEELVVQLDSENECNHFVEVTEMIENCVPDDQVQKVVSSLPQEDLKLYLCTAAAALARVHSRGIVHGDIKKENILCSCNTAGKYVAKLIDFDCSYFLDNKPKPGKLSQSDQCNSPEHREYNRLSFNKNDPDYQLKKAKAAEKITEKSDVYSLGTVFYFYLTGKYPKRDDKENCILSDPLPSSYYNILSIMLAKNPDLRPGAKEVVSLLKGENIFIGEDRPWPGDGVRYDSSILKRYHYINIRRGEAEGVKGYYASREDGKQIFINRTNARILRIVKKV